MILLLRRVHLCFYLAWLLLFFALLYPFYYLFSRSEKTYIALNFCRKINCLIPSWLAGIWFRFSFEKPIDPQKTYIYCANHLSNMDILYMVILGKGPFHFMGKVELLKHPIMRLFFETIDIPVDRSSRISSFKAFVQASENLKAGMDLMIFPEGRIEDVYPPQLQEFKNGPIRLALQLKLPIIPISSIDVWKIMWDNGFRYGTRPGIADIYVHAPIEPELFEGWTEDELKSYVFQQINSKLTT